MKNTEKENAIPFPVYLVYGMDLETKDKDIIRNFCEDYGISEVVEDKYLSVPIAVVDEVYENEPQGVMKIFKGPVRLSGFKLRSEDVDGVRCLIAEYESPTMEKYFEMISDIYEAVDHDPSFDLVIAHHYEGDHDLENLSYHLNRYAPYLTTSGDISGLYDDRETNAIMLGYDEVPEE